jgi:DTW domain-containing protein
MQPKFTPTDPRAKQKFDRSSVCENCFRPRNSCLCDKVTAHSNSLRVVILQHPQEQFKALNSARLTHLSLKNSDIFVGLSWSNFKKVAGPEEMPSQWGVLYLRPDQKKTDIPLSIINPKKLPMQNPSSLKGIIALDGSWKQSKALWWRNAWLLKINRISLNPDHPSLRPQVKNEGLSTIEAVAFTLEHLGEKPSIPVSLREQYSNLIIGKK